MLSVRETVLGWVGGFILLLGNKDEWVFVTSEYSLCFLCISFQSWSGMKIELWSFVLTWGFILSSAHFSGIIARPGILTFVLACSHMTEVFQQRTGCQCLVISPSDMCAEFPYLHNVHNYCSFILLEVSTGSLKIVRFYPWFSSFLGYLPFLFRLRTHILVNEHVLW